MVLKTELRTLPDGLWREGRNIKDEEKQDFIYYKFLETDYLTNFVDFYPEMKLIYISRQKIKLGESKISSQWNVYLRGSTRLVNYRQLSVEC